MRALIITLILLFTAKSSLANFIQAYNLEEIKKIPKGSVKTYKEIACNLGNPNSSRAVANACAKNPLIIEIPCHRVIRSDGFLGGYSAEGGIKRKKYMLEKEGHKFNKDKIIL